MSGDDSPLDPVQQYVLRRRLMSWAVAFTALVLAIVTIYWLCY